jgi:hypothetical protein
MVDWADDIKDQMVREIDLLDTAIARQEQELRGADPATIGTVLKPLIAGKDCSDVSWETLAYSLSLEIATLHTSLPAGLLMRAAREVMKKKTGYHKRRIEAGDLIAAVKPAIEVEEERLRRLKDIRAKVAHLKDRRR